MSNFRKQLNRNYDMCDYKYPVIHLAGMQITSDAYLCDDNTQSFSINVVKFPSRVLDNVKRVHTASEIDKL